MWKGKHIHRLGNSIGRKLKTYRPKRELKTYKPKIKDENKILGDKLLHSRRWRKVSKSYLFDNPLCVHCKGPASQVHHIIERHVNPDLAFEPSNFESTCRKCHAKITFSRVKQAKTLTESEFMEGLEQKDTPSQPQT